MIKQEHLKDIDFRTRAERQKEAIPEMKNWYAELSEYTRSHDYNPIIQGQLTMLSSVLWYLLPEKDYKRLTKLK